MPDADEVAGALRLSAGDASADLYPDVGGRLGQLDFGEGPLLRGPAPDLDWLRWGSYPLVPWSNRIPGGALRCGDVDARLPVNFPDGSAIHGLGADRPWTLAQASERAAELVVDLEAGPYWVRAVQSFELEPERLRHRLAVTNHGASAVPAGLGIHPWFRAGPITIPADEVWPGEPMPTGPPVPVTGKYDLRAPVVAEEMDACFTALTGAAAEVPGLTLRWDGPVTNIVVYTGVAGWVCVEPVTMANDGFNLAARDVGPHGVQVVAPGGSLEVRYTFERRSVRI